MDSLPMMTSDDDDEVKNVTASVEWSVLIGKCRNVFRRLVSTDDQVAIVFYCHRPSMSLQNQQFHHPTTTTKKMKKKNEREQFRDCVPSTLAPIDCNGG
jgi:hypothetical protein